MARLRRLRISQARVIALGGIVMAAIGSCGLPNIKPPSIP
jgi:hypothetical protein